MADIKTKRISDLSPKTDITPDAKLPIIDKTAGGSYDNFNMPVALLATLAKGDAGPVGPQGPQGEPGPIPLVKSPNAPSDTDLLWIDTDDDGSMFIGPQGPIGPKGDKGDKGDPGTTDYNALINKPDMSVYATKTEVSNLFIGTTPPTPSIGAQVLWLDTTGGNITLNLVTGE